MDFNAAFQLIVFVVCYTATQGLTSNCNNTEEPSINMCQTTSRSVAADTFIYLDSGGAPIVTKVECNCSIVVSGSGQLNVAYRAVNDVDNCQAEFKMNNITWGCNTVQMTIPYQGTNNLTFTKKFQNPQNWLSCLGIKSAQHSIDVECYPYRIYYAPDEVVNGSFGDWTFTSECSVTCGTGVRTRQRKCDNPAPRNNGTECLATDGTRTLLETENVSCYSSCTVNGVWGPWVNTTSCSATCDTGTLTQTRNCDSPAPQNGGNACLTLNGNNRDLTETRTIDCFETACPVNGVWGPWMNTSSCSITCGSGILNQTRNCDSPAPQNGGDACLKLDGNNRDLVETRTIVCFETACPASIDGNWSDWESWTTCTQSCGGGTRSRDRTCSNPSPENGGQYCSGNSRETENCNANLCPVNGGWSDWSGWSTCSSTCGGGIKIRSRSCTNPQPLYGGAQCLGNTYVSETCGINNCPIDGNWNTWSNWSSCSKSCNGGYQNRYRACFDPYPQYGGFDCTGNSTEFKTCKETDCPINGAWGMWQSWLQCSQNCGLGTQTRYRYCDSPVPQNEGNECAGYYLETKTCYGNSCQVNGQWGSWSPWSVCSASCGTGKNSRYRECNSPSPQHGGLNCDGSSSEYGTCYNTCPVNGEWGPWSPWSTCSESCGEGKASRTRYCDNPAPNYGGYNCFGSSNENFSCLLRKCAINGNWSIWSPWSICAITCGNGSISRIRECNNPKPENGGNGCYGEAFENGSCVKTPCPVDGGYGPWSPWSKCSSSCGLGKRSRLRECNYPVPENGGKKCSDMAFQSTVCNITKCSGTDAGQISQTGSSSTKQSTSQGTPKTQQSVDKEKKEEDSNIGAIIGGTIGGLLLLLLLLLLLICCLRRRRRKKVDRRPSEGSRSVRYISHGDDVTVTENQLYNYDGETPSHATNALFVGGIPETPHSPGEIPHFETGTGDRYAVIMDSNRTKPKSKERPTLDTFHSQEDKPKVETNGDIRASTDTVKLAENYNEDQLGRGIDNPGYEDRYIAPYDSADGATKPKTSSSSPSPYDYIDNEKLKRDDDAFEKDNLAGDYATLPDDLDEDDCHAAEDNERYKRFISSEPEDSADDGYLKSPKHEKTFEFPEAS